MTLVQCSFCKEKKEKAKEHIWPRWLQLNLYGTTKFSFEGSHMTLSTLQTKSRRLQSGESLVYGIVCKDCNTGWMNSLENSFRPLYEAIRNNYSQLEKLSKIERRVIALWSFKTALMINAGSNYRQIIPTEHFDHLFKNRILPKDVIVDVTYIDNSELLRWEQSNFTFSSERNYSIDNADSYDLTKNSYVISMQLEHLGIKVMFYRNCKSNGFKIPNLAPDKNCRISPFHGNSEYKITSIYKNLSEFHMNTKVEK